MHNMSYSISHHKRLNPKKAAVFGKKKSIFKKKAKVGNDDLDYLDWLQSLDRDCFVCGAHGVEWHHIKRDSTSVKDHKRLIPLCAKHHTGCEFSPHGTPVLFRDVYSMEYQYAYADKLYEIYLKEKL